MKDAVRWFAGLEAGGVALPPLGIAEKQNAVQIGYLLKPLALSKRRALPGPGDCCTL